MTPWAVPRKVRADERDEKADNSSCLPSPERLVIFSILHYRIANTRFVPNCRPCLSEEGHIGERDFASISRFARPYGSGVPLLNDGKSNLCGRVIPQSCQNFDSVNDWPALLYCLETEAWVSMFDFFAHWSFVPRRLETQILPFHGRLFREAGEGSEFT